MWEGGLFGVDAGGRRRGVRHPVSGSEGAWQRPPPPTRQTWRGRVARREPRGPWPTRPAGGKVLPATKARGRPRGLPGAAGWEGTTFCSAPAPRSSRPRPLLWPGTTAPPEQSPRGPRPAPQGGRHVLRAPHSPPQMPLSVLEGAPGHQLWLRGLGPHLTLAPSGPLPSTSSYARLGGQEPRHSSVAGPGPGTLAPGLSF